MKILEWVFLSIFDLLRRCSKALFCFFFFLSILAGGSVGAETNGRLIFVSAVWPPVAYQDENGEMQGLYADILGELFENRLGLTVEYKQLPWKRAQQEVKEGLADIMIAIPNEERSQYAVSSKKPFFKLYLNVYTYKNHPRLQEIEQIKTVDNIKKLGLVTVSNMGNAWQKTNIEAAGIPTFYALTEQEACLFLAKKRADIMIDAVIPTNYVIKKLGIAGDLKLTKARFGPINLHLLMSRESDFITLMERIDKVFAELEEEDVVEQFLKEYNSLP